MTNHSTKNLRPYVFENISDGVLLLSRDGTIVYMNKSAQALLNISNDQLGCSLSGVWLKQMDSRNDDVCQAILDALYDKRTQHTKTVNFFTPGNEKRNAHARKDNYSADKAVLLGSFFLSATNRITNRRSPKPEIIPPDQTPSA